MRRDTHLVCLCHCRDFFRFHDSSAMAEIGLDHVASSPFEDRSKLMAPHESLAGGDWNSYRSSHLEERLHVFRRDGFLAEVGKKMLHRDDALHCHGSASPSTPI